MNHRDDDPVRVDRRAVLALLAATGAGGLATADESDDGPCNNLLWALAWKQTAAEYFALCHQAFNLARLRVDAALAARVESERPLAVITDVDDTILHARSYWGYLVSRGMDFFDDALWDEWLPDNDVTAAPGALAFLEHCRANGVEVFYVTSRDQGERTFEYALAQLVHLGFPYADADHLRVFRDSSDKTPARHEVEGRFTVAVTLGDNLNDYRRDYYVTDVDERMALMERDREHWGDDFVLLPNPTDGHWVRAIFGESEPAATPANRRKLYEAATRMAWRRDGA